MWEVGEAEGEGKDKRWPVGRKGRSEGKGEWGKGGMRGKRNGGDEMKSKREEGRGELRG